MNKQTAVKLGMNKPAKYVYQLLQKHHEHVQTHECPCCYTKGNSLVIEHSIASHIAVLTLSEYTYDDIVSILDDLQDMRLIDCICLRDDMYELQLLQLEKPVRAKKKEKAA